MPPRTDERGAASTELTGVIVVVVTVVVLVVGLATPVGGVIAAKLCEVLGTTCGTTMQAGPADAQDDDYLPPACMYHEESQQYSTEISIAFVTIGSNSGFVVQRFRDGRVEVTVTDGAGLGAKGEAPGATFDVGKLGQGDNAGVDVDFGGGLTFGYGDTWVFDSEAEYEAMRSDLDDYLLQQEMQKHPDESGGLGTYFAIKSMGGYVDPPKDPAVKFTQFGVEASLDAALGLREPTGTFDENGEERFLDPNLGATLSVEAGGQAIRKVDTATGEVSWTYELTASGSAGVEIVAGGGSAEGTTQGAFTVTRDADGLVTALEFQSMRAGGIEGHLGNGATFQAGGEVGRGESTRTVVTTRLEVDASNRDLVDSWLGERNPVGQAAALTLPWNAMVPDQPSDDPFLQELYDSATTSAVAYHDIKDVVGFDLAVKAGWKFGFGLSMEEATADAVDAQFLGAPGPDGRRVMIDDATCVE